MGVCMRRELDPETNEEGELKGIRLPIFNYSGREVLAINKWNEKVKAEIQNVKCKSQTEAKIGGWIFDGRPQNAVYEKDDVTHLKKCKKKRQEQLLIGLNIVSYFYATEGGRTAGIAFPNLTCNCSGSGRSILTSVARYCKLL